MRPSGGCGICALAGEVTEGQLRSVAAEFFPQEMKNLAEQDENLMKIGFRTAFSCCAGLSAQAFKISAPGFLIKTGNRLSADDWQDMFSPQWNGR